MVRSFYMAKKTQKKQSAKNTVKKTKAKAKKTMKKPAKKAMVKKAVSKKKPAKKQNRKEKIVAVSGGFDPVHIGHVRMFKEAKKLGDKLVVILNNDNWLVGKKGYAFMPEEERKEIILAFAEVDEVILTGHQPNYTDRSVCAELEAIRPHIFANGGDRSPEGDPVPEVELCNRLGIKLVYNLGHGGKVQSSSWLLKKHEDFKQKAKSSSAKKATVKAR